MIPNLSQKVIVSFNIESQDNQPPSPTFGTMVKPAIQNVGKHGQSQHEYMKVMQRHQSTDNNRRVTPQQLSQHKSMQSAWLSLNGIVYDVTVYLNYHPGGDILLEGCGKECDDLFDQYHSWVNGKRLLEKYKIGFLG